MVYSRNHTLEMLKLFAAYMVVFIHVRFHGTIGAAINALARFSVPFFFLVSGFFSYGITLDRIKRRIAHLVFLLAFSALLGTACNAAMFLIKQDFGGLMQYFQQYLDFRNILRLLLFNKTVQVEYLWYLFAALYVCVLFYISMAHGMKDRTYWTIALSALCLHLILGELLSIFGIFLPNYIVRNYALMGIPFFGLGMLANKYQHKMARVSNCTIVVLIAVGILETLVSWYFLGIIELYLGSVLILFSLVAVFIKFPNAKPCALSTLLTGCNAYIYILHPIISGFIINIYIMLGIPSGGICFRVLRGIHPLVVCVISTILAYALNKIMEPLERRIKYRIAE